MDYRDYRLRVRKLTTDIQEIVESFLLRVNTPETQQALIMALNACLARFVQEVELPHTIQGRVIPSTPPQSSVSHSAGSSYGEELIVELYDEKNLRVKYDNYTGRFQGITEDGKISWTFI